MPKEITNKKNRSSGIEVFPKIVCRSPWCVTKVKALPNYVLEVTFYDGTHGVVEMSSCIMGKDAGVFAALRDKTLFGQVYVGLAAVTWPGEIDLAPDTMHDEIKKNGRYIVK